MATHSKDDTLIDISDASGGDAGQGANPWSSSTDLKPDVESTAQVAALNSETAAGSILQPTRPESSIIAQEPGLEDIPEQNGADASVLDEFDPLTSDPVEQNARDAWATAESHPPPLPAQDSSLQDGSIFNATAPSSAPSSAFPSSILNNNEHVPKDVAEAANPWSTSTNA